MLSYQHAYHAGNHADILKHYVLSFVINSLNNKEKPYTVYDTHAGSGLYDLLDNRSQKTKEAETGIIKLVEYLSKNNDKIPEGFQHYLNLISNFTKKNMYPGSPAIEQELIRSQDFLILSELHPQEIENLKKNISDTNKNVQIHNRSGWEMLKALTPPVTKRGMVLIDPSYEESKDYNDAADVICSVYKKWTNGIFLLWYPLLLHREREINQMINKITTTVHQINQNTQVDNFQLCVYPKNSHKEVSLEEYENDKKNPPRLYGSGMLVINTPWHLEQEAQEVIKLCESIFYCS